LGDDSGFPEHKLQRTRKMERHMLRHVSMILMEKKRTTHLLSYIFFSKRKEKERNMLRRASMILMVASKLLYLLLPHHVDTGLDTNSVTVSNITSGYTTQLPRAYAMPNVTSKLNVSIFLSLTDFLIACVQMSFHKSFQFWTRYSIYT
jgi:hypothetical protein